jgi:RHS repeat-associated protein
MGNWTLFIYDGLGRLSKTVRNASRPTYNLTADPTLKHYIVSTNADLDLMTEFVYDPAERMMYTVDELGRRDWTAYDGLSRRTKTINNASGTAADGGVKDPRSDVYSGNLNLSDQDQVSLIHYDSSGRVWRTRDNLGNYTLFGYDSLNRQVKVIENASNFSYNTASDAALARYTPAVGAAPDQDIIRQTIYNGQGRIAVQIDTLGNETRFTYDALERPIQTVENFVTGSFNPARPDQDLVSTSLYDLAGRLITTVDARGTQTIFAYDKASRQRVITQAANTSLATQSYTCYDKAGRMLRRIENWMSEPPFPLTSTLDNFNRADSTTSLGPNWTLLTNFFGTLQNQGIISNQLYNPAPIWSNYCAMYWNPATYGPDCEVHLSIPTRPTPDADAPGLYARVTNPGASLNGYAFFINSSLNEGYIVRIDNGVSTQLGAAFNCTIASGDKIGLRLIGSTIMVYQYTAGNWNLLATRIDGTYINAGYMGFYIPGGVIDGRYDNFGGGTIELQLPAGNTFPDARDGQGNWLFAPGTHGPANDQNLITSFVLDRLGRPTAITNPAGDSISMTYFADGQMESTTDPLGVVTKHRYDQARRRVLTVQSYQANGEDPALWKWNGSAWTKSDGTTAITFGTDKDQNIIVLTEYDKAGRSIAMRDPRGNRTVYTYDQLDRRTGLTNPLNNTWVTAYTNLPSGTLRTSLTDANGNVTQQDTDRRGLPLSIQYLNESPKKTPDVLFAYDKVGNRLSMTEVDGATTVRKANFAYDRADRLTQASFDRAGDGSDVQVVGYEYDAGGLRTKLTLPGSLNVTYTYNTRGQLVSLTDWDSQQTQLTYDRVDRLASAQRANNLLSSYQHDTAGRLTLVRHTANNKTLSHFAYTVDPRGNRTQVYQGVPRSTTGTTTLAYNDPGVYYYQGTWSDANPFKTSTSTNAALRLAFLSSQVTLTMGTGPDHGIYDIYVDGSFQQTVDGYAGVASEQGIGITLGDEGPHILEVRNTGTKNASSTGFKVRYKSLATPVTAQLYDLQTVAYGYDAAARLKSANRYPGVNTTASATRSDAYSYDVTGNRTQQVVTVGGSPTTTNYVYNNGNQMTSDGTNIFGYDNNGNLITANSFPNGTYDRANRGIDVSTDGLNFIQYAYDGLGRRVQQTNGANVTKYVLDVQPGLWEVLAATTGANTTRYVHGLRGLHAQEDNAGNWTWPVEDALGSIHTVVNNSVSLLESRQYTPYGEVSQASGSSQTVYGFTGEPTDSNGVVYLRARGYIPVLGRFPNMDRLETLNRYAYADDDPINHTDPTGLIAAFCSGLSCAKSSTPVAKAAAPAPKATAIAKASAPKPTPAAKPVTVARPTAAPAPKAVATAIPKATKPAAQTVAAPKPAVLPPQPAPIQTKVAPAVAKSSAVASRPATVSTKPVSAKPGLGVTSVQKTVTAPAAHAMTSKDGVSPQVQSTQAMTVAVVRAVSQPHSSGYIALAYNRGISTQCDVVDYITGRCGSLNPSGGLAGTSQRLNEWLLPDGQTIIPDLGIQPNSEIGPSDEELPIIPLVPILDDSQFGWIWRRELCKYMDCSIVPGSGRFSCIDNILYQVWEEECWDKFVRDHHCGTFIRRRFVYAGCYGDDEPGPGDPPIPSYII